MCMLTKCISKLSACSDVHIFCSLKANSLLYLSQDSMMFGVSGDFWYVSKLQFCQQLGLLWRRGLSKEHDEVCVVMSYQDIRILLKFK